MPTSSNSSIILQPKLFVLGGCSSTEDHNEIECSMHTLPKPLLREFGHVFGEKYLTDDISATPITAGSTEDAMDEDPPVVPPSSSSSAATQQQHLELIAIPTNQRARRDLVAVGDDVEQERDRLLNVVCTHFNKQFTLFGIPRFDHFFLKNVFLPLPYL